jgi:hypothetical protein
MPGPIVNLRSSAQNFRHLVVGYDRALTIHSAFFHISCFLIALRRVLKPLLDILSDRPALGLRPLVALSFKSDWSIRGRVDKIKA